MPFEGVLVEAYKGTRRKHNMKFRQIGHTTSQHGHLKKLLVHGIGLLLLKLRQWLYLDHMPAWTFKKTISAWNRLAFAEAPSMAVFISHFLNN